MNDFKPIESQEQFDAMIADRLKRQEEKIRAEYEGFEELKNQLKDKDNKLNDLNKKLEEATASMSNHDKEVEQLKNDIRKYETDSAKTRIANEEGLPYDMAFRLKGETEDEIREDAKSMAKYLKPATPPVFNPEPLAGSDKEAAWNKLSNDLIKKEY